MIKSITGMDYAHNYYFEILTQNITISLVDLNQILSYLHLKKKFKYSIFCTVGSKYNCLAIKQKFINIILFLTIFSQHYPNKQSRWYTMFLLVVGANSHGTSAV